MCKENCSRIPQQRLFINTLLSSSLKVRKSSLKMLFLNTLIPPKSPINLRIFLFEMCQFTLETIRVYPRTYFYKSVGKNIRIRGYKFVVFSSKRKSSDQQIR